MIALPTMFSERNVLIASGTYERSYSQRNYLVFWKSVPMAYVLITRLIYDVLIAKVLISRVDCIDDKTACKTATKYATTGLNSNT